MKSVYTFRNDKKKICISFELDNEETADDVRDNLAYDYLVDLLKLKYEEVRDDFYQDDVVNIEDKEEKI